MAFVALNCGSSSIKLAVFASEGLARALDARVEALGTDKASLRYGGHQEPLPAGAEPGEAARLILERVSAKIAEPVVAVVHRVVHGGERFTQPTLIDDTVLNDLDTLGSLAPLHNPPAIAAVRAARDVFPNIPHFAVFDTAFHTTLPRRSREYALPKELRERLGIRRFGFHGISHSHVMDRIAAAMGADARDLRIVSCHLGNGASVTAVEYGRSVETSMGMTPLEGLVMGTRAGDIDPGVLLELLHTHDRDALESLLTRKSGLVGLTGTNDMRAVEQRAAEGDEECRLALNLYAHRVRKYIGAYAATMGGVDAIAFTGGVGENSALVRHRCVQRLDFLGAVLDEDRNRDGLPKDVESAEISGESSRVRMFVLRADEERAMAEAIAPLMGRSRVRQDRVPIPIAVSARHAHLSQTTLEQLFGHGFRLDTRSDLSQKGQFAATQTVTLIGPRGRLEKVRLMGPPRAHDQVEISRTDEFSLGIDAPVRISGDLANTPGITVEGPKGRVTLTSGVIAARRHIHMSVDDAKRLGVQDHDVVAVRIDSKDRDLTFNDVSVRVAPDFRLELHLDTDEANAAGVKQGDVAELIVTM